MTKEVGSPSRIRPRLIVTLLAAIGLAIGLGLIAGLLKEPQANPSALAQELKHAAIVGDLAAARALLTRPELNANALDADGRSALLLAAENGNAAIVEILLQHGADPNIADRDGLIPMRAAAVRGHTAIVQAILLHNQKNPIRPQQTQAMPAPPTAR